MAQKTPLPAKTVMYADRWNSTWFVDLENFRTQLLEDYHLRFLLTGFLRLKKQWLHLLSIHKSGGFYFFQVITLKSFSSGNHIGKIKPLLAPIDSNRQTLFKLNFLVKKTNLLKNSDLDTFKFPKRSVWKKRTPYQKSLIWTRLQQRVRFFKQSFFGYPGKKYIKKQQVFKKLHTKASKFKHFIKWDAWMRYNQNKVALKYYNSFLTKFFYKPKNSVNVLLDQQKGPNSLLKAKLGLVKQLKNTGQSIPNKTAIAFNTKENKVFMPREHFTQKYKTSRNKDNKKGYVKLTKKTQVNVNNKRFFSTLTFTQINKNKKEMKVIKHKQKTIIKNNNNFLKILSKKKSLKIILSRRGFYNVYKKHVNLYKMIYRVSSYFYKRMFRYKKYPTIKMGLRKLYKKYGYSLKYTHMLRRFSTSMLFICRALNRVTAMQCYVYYLPIEWNKKSYKFLKKAMVFERYCYQKSFVPSVALLHLAMSRGSATLITDLLVRKLRRAFLHLPFLGAVEQICRYLIAPYESDRPFKDSLCKGIEITFKGKVNGNDRAKTWRFQLGPVHTSTFYTNTREQVAKCVTRYGVFRIRVRLKLGERLFTDYENLV